MCPHHLPRGGRDQNEQSETGPPRATKQDPLSDPLPPILSCKQQQKVWPGRPILSKRRGTSNRNNRESLLLRVRFLIKLNGLKQLPLFPILRRHRGLIFRLPKHNLLTGGLFRFDTDGSRIAVLLFLFFARGAISRVQKRLIFLIRLTRPLYLALKKQDLLTLGKRNSVLLILKTRAKGFRDQNRERLSIVRHLLRFQRGVVRPSVPLRNFRTRTITLTRTFG